MLGNARHGQYVVEPFGMHKLTEKLKSERLRTRYAAPVDARAKSWSTRAPAYNPAKAVGSFVPKLTRKAFESHGFSAATLLTDWALIVGAELAAATIPERLKWPRAAAHPEARDAAEVVGGATLTLAVDPALALEVSYRERQITERINRYFGYRAVTALRLVQRPIETSPLRPAVPVASPRQVTAPIEAGDEELSRALTRMQSAILARG